MGGCGIALVVVGALYVVAGVLISWLIRRSFRTAPLRWIPDNNRNEYRARWRGMQLYCQRRASGSWSWSVHDETTAATGWKETSLEARYKAEAEAQKIAGESGEQ